jgi:hypothetical protein
LSAIPVIGRDAEQQVVPVREDEGVAEHTDVVPEVLLTPNILPEPLIGPVGEFEDLVEEEGEEVEEKKVEGEVLHPMAVVVVDMVAMILHGVEDLVLDHPSRSPDTNHLLDTVVIEG